MNERQRHSYILNVLAVTDVILFVCMLWLCFGAWREDERSEDCYLASQVQEKLLMENLLKEL